jgi:hypothetical protein
MNVSGEFGRRTTSRDVASDTDAVWCARPISMAAFVAAMALLAGLAFVVSTSPALAAPSGVPDSGTVQVDGRVNAILPIGNRIYLGGEFTHVNGVSRNYLAAVDATTGQPTDWAPSANARVRALAASPDGSRIYAGGSFSQVNGLTRWRLVSLDATTGAVDPNWKPTPDSGVYALAVSANRLYVGGNFLSINGQGRSHLALIDRSTGALDPNWTPSANRNFVRALTLSADGSKVYAGGDFTTISGQSKPYLASWNTSTGALDSNFRPPSPNGEIFALALLGGRVFTAEGGPGGAMAAYDAATGTRAWRNTADGDAESITTLGNRVYVAGHFELVRGQARDAFVAFDPSTGALDPNWTPVAEPIGTDVWALASDASRGRVYAGGDFTGISGQNRQRFAQFSDPLVTQDTSPPETTIDSGPTGAVNTDTATFSFSSSEQNSSFQCSLDGATFSSCTSPKSYAGLTQGSHTFSVKATDSAGNTDTTPATRSWTVDSLAPAAPSIDSPAENSLVRADFTLSGAAEPNATVEVFEGNTSRGTTQANGSGFWSKALSGVGEGSHTYTTKATDATGNVSPKSNAHTLTVDSTAPAVVDVTPQDGTSGVSVADNVLSSFSEAMDPSTISATTFTLVRQGSLAPISATVSYDPSARKGTLDPSQDLEANTTYTATIKGGANGARDLAGNALEADKRWSFTTAAAAKTRNVLAFDGIDDRATIPNSGWVNLVPSTQRTFEAFIKTGSDTNARQVLYEEGGESNGFSVEISGGRLYFNAWSTTNGWRTVFADVPVSPNTIYRVAGVYQGSSGEVRLYLDGLLEDTSTGVGSMPQHADGVALGGINGSTRDHTNAIIRAGSNFGGYLGEFRVWDRALTQDQISTQMETNLSGNEAGLIVLYELGEGSGTLLKDSGVHHLDGTISGASWGTLSYTPPG